MKRSRNPEVKGTSKEYKINSNGRETQKSRELQKSIKVIVTVEKPGSRWSFKRFQCRRTVEKSGSQVNFERSRTRFARRL